MEEVGYAIDLRHPAKAVWSGDEIALERVDVRLRRREAGRPSKAIETESFLVFSGTSDTSGNLDLSTHGQLALDLVRPYITSLFTRSEGLLKLEGSLKGPSTHLKPELVLTLDSAEFSPRSGLIGSRLKLMEPVQLVMSPLNADPGEAQPKTGSFELNLAEQIDDDGNQVPMRMSRDDTVISADEVYGKFLAFRPDRLRVAHRGTNSNLIATSHERKRQRASNQFRDLGTSAGES